MMRPRRQNPQTTGKRGLKMRSFKKETHRALCKTATFFGRPAAPEPGSTQHAGSTSNMPPHDPFNEGRCHMAKRFPLSSDHAIMLIPMTAGSALSPSAVFLAAHGDVLNQSIYARAWPVDAAA